MFFEERGQPLVESDRLGQGIEERSKWPLPDVVVCSRWHQNMPLVADLMLIGYKIFCYLRFMPIGAW